MIFVLTAQSDLATQLVALLDAHSLRGHALLPHKHVGLELLYQPETVGAVVDARVPFMPDHAWHDLLASLCRRMPVVVLGQAEAPSGVARVTESISWLASPTAQEILLVLDQCGAVGIDHRVLQRESIPLFNPQIPLHMLQNNGALSVLYVDASSFRKIAIEYGGDAYARVQRCFNQILYDLWGTPGSFRASDVLCRRSSHANGYYIFLEQSRSSGAIPAPGVLERLAERLVVRLQNAFWKELFVERSKRLVPDCISVVPDLAVGFGTVIYNPCVDALEMVESVLEHAAEESRAQLRRIRERQRELMQSLIHSPGMLRPNYQGVFALQPLTRELVDEARSSKSIKKLVPHLFGFESLIRVRPEAIEHVFDPHGPVYMDGRFMRPDVLFALAHSAKVGLELDQTCLHLAVVNAGELPGVLLLNILPRNLYNIDRLRHLIMHRKDIMFEVSETEAINNFDLMLKVRATIEKMDMRIATDDFGRGYSGLEQIIKIKPDLIKLDRSLIQDIHNDRPKQAFVSGLVKAAQISRATILAEGVELWDEAEVLQKMGIDLVQGFLVHRPQAVQDILLDLQGGESEADLGPDELGNVA